MSIKIMSEVWDMNFAKISHKNVLLALADCANDEGYCYPSISIISKKANISTRSVYTALRELEECKYIAKNQRQRHDGSLTSNEYYITLKNTSEIISGGSEMTSGGSEMTSGGSEATSPLLNITTNEPSINHQVTKEKNKKENPAIAKEKNDKPKLDLANYPNLNLEAFNEWCEYKGNKYSVAGKRLSANKLNGYDKDTQLKMVEQSIMNNYQGLFEVKKPNGNSAVASMNEELSQEALAILRGGDEYNHVLDDNWLSRGVPDAVLEFNRRISEQKELQNKQFIQIGGER